MTQVVLHSPSHFSSPPSSLTCASNDGVQQHQPHSLINPSSPVEDSESKESKDEEEDQLSLLALLVAVFRKSLVACRTQREEDLHRSMEIGWPTNVQHVAHVTFDRFNGFLGLPVEFEPEVPRRAPSASANVFGVSTESMQCSYDSRGNSVPTILLLMQRRLYCQGGLQAEGIFRINAENSQEEFVRDQLNTGIVPDGIDVHCLAGLIKAWFRELPSGVLDSLTPEQVMQCQTEEECAELVRLLPLTEAALLDWAINLMADVVQEEHHNKMNARNVAMVFAPNMTQMADPLTALMYAVQVMNFLKTLILKTLKDRQDSVLDATSVSHSDPSDENGHCGPSQPPLEAILKEDTNPLSVSDEPISDGLSHLPDDDDSTTIDTANSIQTSCEKAIPEENGFSADDFHYETPAQTDFLSNGLETTDNSPKTGIQANPRRSKTGQSSNSNLRKGARKGNGQQSIARMPSLPTEKTRGISIVSRINSRVERVEAWR
eukprot:TRINITY_DN22121_c0_g1_i1.p1 TRINITY_DN22121_c0_g1~~TRINITY_DN22121_c0_g1_i1.p1  ORF type:complete len:490 (-),score=77.75 TRINITY_DN22121_c0_g1_i1:243-1712(-)